MRKLVTIRQIDKLIPIEGKDLICVAQIDGWNVIVKKSEFSEGSQCAFFEIDSFLPNKPIFKFLKKTTTYQGKVGYRLKTMRMAGVISQGLALPLHMFPELTPSMELGADVTDLLGVVKYDNQVVTDNKRPGLKAGNAQSKFPSFIPKTDQKRIQNLTSYFKIYEHQLFEETLKLDGSSMTCYKIAESLPWYKLITNKIAFTLFESIPFNPFRFGVCSRNLEIKPTDSHEKTFDNNGKTSTYRQSDFWDAARSYGIESKLPIGYAVQGELIGPRIQSNHEKVDKLEYYIFDVYDIENSKYLLPDERHKFCAMYDLPHIPIVNNAVAIFEECTDVKSLLTRVEGESMNPSTISEGRVYKSTTTPTITFKCISNKYLLKAEK